MKMKIIHRFQKDKKKKGDPFKPEQNEHEQDNN
jgi:hypothetical protein